VRPKVALALSGGGPLGAIYEIGALCALEESLIGLDLNRLHHYVGVSAGGFIAAALANGMSPRALCATFIDDNALSGDHFDPAWLMVPAYGEFARRALMLPALAASTWWRWAVGGKSFTSSIERLATSLPTGVFSNDEVDKRLAQLFSSAGRSNDFRQLKTRLTLVATNLDSGEATPFGRPGWDHVPISKAVQASSALPGLFPPVEIDGSYYVDGALKKTMHASMALEDGIDLMLCLNPLVPFDATVLELTPDQALDPLFDQRKIPRIVDGGLPAVLSQTFRSMIHSRLALGMKGYELAYPQTDIVLIEPDHRDPELYLANTFSYSQRRHLAEHAYQQTRALLRSGKSDVAQKLARHGIRLNLSRLNDPKRHLAPPPVVASPIGRALGRLHEVLEALDHAIAPDLHPKR
jgi:predicted acylesterase/phospholipase RssA